MTDLLEDIQPVRPHPDVDMGLPPAEKNPRRITPLALRDSDRAALDQLSALMKMPREEVLSALIHRALPHANGKAGYENTCSSCGRPYQSNRRALPGRRSYCPDCRKSGEPAADRARDYRDRKAKERTQ